MGNHLHIHQSPASDIQPCGNPVHPVCHGISGAVAGLPPFPAPFLPPGRRTLCSGGFLRRYHVLSPGKYRSHLYPGIQRGRHHLHCAFLYRYPGLDVPGEERPRFRFFAGFLLAMAGISLISFGNETALSLNPTGDLLAVAAAVIWAVYSTLTKKISALGHGTVQSTRRTFFTGFYLWCRLWPSWTFPHDTGSVYRHENILNLLFLGLGASALCFVTWNTGVKILGPVKTSVYIYMVPVITTLTSALILKEPVTVPAALGIIMTLAGLFLSEQKTTGKGEPKIWTTKMKNV